MRTVLRPRKPAPLPPGPRGLPLIGNVLDMPSEKEWLTFAEWGEEWGVYMTDCLSIELKARSHSSRRHLFSNCARPTLYYPQLCKNCGGHA